MEFQLPDLGEGIVEAELVEWHVHPGDEVRRGQTLLEVMTDKAVVEVPAPFDGVVQELVMKPGDEIQIGQPVLIFDSAEEEAEHETPSAAEAQVAESPKAETRKSPSRISAAPAVRRKARESGIELAAVEGTGPGGRVLLRDLETITELRGGKGNGRKAGPPPTSEERAFAPGSRIKLRGLRRAIALAMTRSLQTIPQYSLIDECDATALVAMRNSLKETCDIAAVKLTYLAFMVRAAVAALKETPLVNATLDEDAEEIVLHDHYHIGIATATPEGLVVPVIHDADRKDILEIAREIERLADAARRGRLRPEELRGGTFTITSIGNIGGLMSTPIIRLPEVAIMGAGKIIRRPLYDEHGQLRPADLLYLSFTFDHRVIDGDVGTLFSQAVIHRLENPAGLLLSPTP